MQQLLLIGAGGFGRETAEAVRAINDARATWDLLGFLDDDPSLCGTELDGTRVLGAIKGVARFPDARIVVCTGHPGNYFSRKRIVRSLGIPVARYATLVHPTAVVPRSARLGPGSVLLASVVLTAAVEVGAHVLVMPGVVFTHEDVIGDFATFGAGSRLGGRTRIREGAYLGAGTTVREERTIGRWSLVGMGAAVIRDIPDAEVWAGVPARFLRQVDVPLDVIRGGPAESVTSGSK